MRNFKPIKYFVDNEMSTLSQKQIRRNVIQAIDNKDPAVRLVKNSKNRDQYEVDVNECEHILGRKNRISQVPNIANHRPDYISLKSDYKNDFYSKGAHLFGKKKCNNEYNVEATLNLKLFKNSGIKINNDYNKDVYEFIIDLLKKHLNKFFYQIEIDSGNNYHLHMGIAGKLDEVNEIIFNTIYSNFGLIGNLTHSNIDQEKQYAIQIQEMIDEDLYIKYISKGSDGLGGFSPIFYCGSNQLDS